MHDIDDTDTIASLATPPGRGGIGIVRMSGPGALEIIRRIFSGDIPDGETHRLYYGHIREPGGGEVLDEVMVGVMLAPRSYTRQDVVEINCHGGPVLLDRVLGLTIKMGARPAEPGEFTRRAFMNGRLDLTEAEAVLDLIDARSREAGRLAMDQLRGRLSERISRLRDGLLMVCSEIEAHLDFPEEEIEPSSIERLRLSVGEAASEVEKMSMTFEGGRLFREGLRTAIVGRPNVGKSSILNALVEEERAIVAEVPGTTRDIIEDFISIKGLPLRIMDTAGIRESHDMVEQEGVRRSLRALEEADLAIAVFDASQSLHDEDSLVLEKLEGRKSLLVSNKCDLPQVIDLGGRQALSVSAQKGEGIEALREAIYETALRGAGGFDVAEGLVITNERHKAALDRGMASLRDAQGSLGTGPEAHGAGPLEVTAMELRETLGHLDSIIGDVTADDILNNIFSRFCIGK
jgi:tRNA modification GTPase